MDRSDRILALLQHLYAAPGDPAGWITFFEHLRIAVHGSACSLASKNIASEQCILPMTTGVPEAHQEYDQHWGAMDPWAHSPRARLIFDRSVVVGDELVERRDMQRSAYYADYASRYEMVRALVGVLRADANVLSVVTINGSERHAGFDEDDVALLELLVPHIRRAVDLHQRLVGAIRTADDLASAIDRFSRALLLVDVTGRVVFMNQMAALIMASRDGLTVDRGELRGVRLSDTARLRTILHEAIKTSGGAIGAAGGVIAIGRPSGARPFIVSVSPASHRRVLFPGAEHAAAIVFVTDPEEVASPDADTLRSCSA
jgi:hypothetical protein